MAQCSTLCSTTIPALNNGCRVETKNGGIEYVAVMTCDVAFTDPCNLAEWINYIQEGKIRLLGKGSGETTAPSVTTQSISGCGPEVVTGMEHTLTFTDFNIDTEYGSNAHLYDELINNPTTYTLAWFDCAGTLYGLSNRNTSDGTYAGSIMRVEAGHIIPATDQEFQRFEVNFIFRFLGVFLPFVIDGLLNTLIDNQGYNPDGTYGDYTSVCPQ